MKNIYKTLSVLFVVFGYLNTIQAQQQILLDKPVRAGELILFPDLNNRSNYYYLPDKPQLASHPTGDPIFSFLRYVKNEETAADSNEGISESTVGGGIVHALVELKVPDKMIKDAERALSRVDSNGKIIGPVVFKSGTVSLISSVAKPNGEFEAKVCGLGNAPILENQRSAVSVHINKLGSKILWETFNTPTPDFSTHFEMEVEGYQSPKRVTIEANFDRIYKHQTFEAAIAAPVLSAEIKASFDDLFDSGAIKLTQIGDDEELNKLKEAAYTQLMNLMFDKVGGTGVPQLNQLIPNNQKSMLDRATEQLQNARKEAREENRRIDALEQSRAERNRAVQRRAQSRADSVRTAGGHEPITRNQDTTDNGDDTDRETPQREPIPSLSVAVSYQMKQVRRRGVYKIDLNKYTQTTKTLPFDYNLGDVKSKCPSCFREINADDALMKQRQINATLGGMNTDDFKHVNFVNVIMRKKHGNNQETVDEIKIDKSEFNKQGNFFKMLYGWKGDDDRDKWLAYDYKTLWSFKGNHKIESDWETTKFGSIALEPPLVKKPIYIEIDEDFTLEKNIKAVEIKVYSKLGDKNEVSSTNLRVNKSELTKTIEILLPRNSEDYEYEITYFIRGESPKKSGLQKSDYGRIDIDRFM
ncbi:hypothetical protein EV195_10893 [Tenacibaculum skagerrakense]|uniref:Uncharacterized protein n=1 Tax=Tenacibaculum skagerrakense TaxID=186571 RepID=A0A4R2NP92_9FLAO|nr:hypothetical protein [Tenacibaculum skagerrakense]TCP23623.1 hypothetical protein EV195_10893 [Tenacibaculum skagerrakense]